MRFNWWICILLHEKLPQCYPPLQRAVAHFVYTVNNTERWCWWYKYTYNACVNYYQPAHPTMLPVAESFTEIFLVILDNCRVTFADRLDHAPVPQRHLFYTHGTQTPVCAVLPVRSLWPMLRRWHFSDRIQHHKHERRRSTSDCETWTKFNWCLG